MRTLKHLFDNNRRWAERIRSKDPEFFEKLQLHQEPSYLWIGCSDSRVPATEIVDLLPGELFVHRNVGNLVIHTDLNCLSVIQFAVQVLKVQDIIICGHYGCGAVKEAMSHHELGLIDNWLRHIKDVYTRHEQALNGIPDENTRFERLCELNVIEQVHNVCHSTIVQDAWRDGQSLGVHGWIYGLCDGLLKDLNICITSQAEIDPIYRVATAPAMQDNS